MKITPEVTEALAKLRNTHYADMSWQDTFEILDNAGVFSAIDEAISKCDCPPSYAANDHHRYTCPVAPAGQTLEKRF